ncbi:hypothetical protein ACR8AL_09030 [Clavibacter sepedonicus]|uniref:Uncharacterized protein n=1 Tax=Clavibacter sepedonicus TaxID=31964 RepID=B0RE17_CLASE|nr:MULTISPECIES: hypothetical protein [Clavibacter]OQJ47623.1 hypothetical protein B5P19_04525 [Clavibacter sepedonicus]OQJ53178.1 hypothetical protein B5P20_02785 [Clavibacter sepedonicus]UUK64337.1 hypothetical protein LRE50_08455 [Clavibacter sepedonicus]CAQ01978.1 hypothetical protein CMS1876 [Clavibacter sepedonicus]
MIRLRRRRPPVEPESPYPARSFLRNPAVPAYDDWLPSGIAGCIRLSGYPHPWVMARRNGNDFFLRDDAYRLKLPEDVLRYGDGEYDWTVGTAEGAFAPAPEGSIIDVVTTVLEVEWDASPEAWQEARAWFVRDSERRWDSMMTGERRSIERLVGRRRRRTSQGYFDVDPFDGPI